MIGWFEGGVERVVVRFVGPDKEDVKFVEVLELMFDMGADIASAGASRADIETKKPLVPSAFDPP